VIATQSGSLIPQVTTALSRLASRALLKRRSCLALYENSVVSGVRRTTARDKRALPLDPNLSAAELAQLAAERPDLRRVLVARDNAPFVLQMSRWRSTRVARQSVGEEGR